jgi:hypothetical protein
LKIGSTCSSNVIFVLTFPGSSVSRPTADGLDRIPRINAEHEARKKGAKGLQPVSFTGFIPFIGFVLFDLSSHAGNQGLAACDTAILAGFLLSMPPFLRLHVSLLQHLFPESGRVASLIFSRLQTDRSFLTGSGRNGAHAPKEKQDGGS